jgi:hypothetical protein
MLDRVRTNALKIAYGSRFIILIKPNSEIHYGLGCEEQHDVAGNGKTIQQVMNARHQGIT